MSIFTTRKVNDTTDRPSVLIQLRLIDKGGDPVDASEAWAALVLAFKDHPHFAVSKCEIRPDKDETKTSI